MYGNHSGIFYYLDGLIKFLKTKSAQLNDAAVWLVKIQVLTAALKVTIAVNKLPATVSKSESMYKFYEIMKTEPQN